MENIRRINVLQNGVIEVRDVTKHEDGTKSKPHRVAICPGDTKAAKIFQVEDISNQEWTQEKVAAFKEYAKNV